MVGAAPALRAAAASFGGAQVKFEQMARASQPGGSKAAGLA